MEKSSDAFRTISEVAEDLMLPQHVLRFWETKFPHIRPLKRAGGRRYYRPADVILLRTIRQLLYDEGYTIKGVQKLMREQGARSFRAGVVPMAELPDAGVHQLPAGEAMPVAQAPTAWVESPHGNERVGELGRAAPPPQAARASLRDILAIIDECGQILEALHPSPP